MWRKLLRLLRFAKATTPDAWSSRPIGEPASSPDQSDTATVQAKSAVSSPTNKSARSQTGTEGPTRRRPPGRSFIDLVIGLDLGTSSTKVAVRTPYAYNKRVVAAALRPRTKGLERYLVPTCLAVRNDGGLALDTFGGARQVTDLKVRLLDEAARRRAGPLKQPKSEDSSAILATGYLTIVLRRVAEWFDATQSKYFRGMTPRWQLNIGIPSAGYDDEGLRTVYGTVARAAWWLSRRDNTVTLTECAKALEAAAAPGFDWGLPSDAFAVVPEVAAEVVGYARSALRDIGLHLLVDVGASTMDVCGFVLHEHQGDDRYELLTGDVQRLGAFQLHKFRVERVRGLRQGNGWLASIADSVDPLTPIPDSVRDYVMPTPTRGEETSLAKIDEEFMVRCRLAVVGTVIALKRNRDPNSKRWGEGLPVFMAGGGSRLRLYRDAISSAEEELQQVTTVAGLRIRSLPKPQSLDNEDLSDADFQFLAVAYGLSHEKIEIGDIRSPSEIPDIEPPRRRDWESRFIDKDQV